MSAKSLNQGDVTVLCATALASSPTGSLNSFDLDGNFRLVKSPHNHNHVNEWLIRKQTRSHLVVCDGAHVGKDEIAEYKIQASCDVAVVGRAM